MIRAWFWFLKHAVNPWAVRAVHAGRGPFSLVRHVGRKTGRAYETPLLLVADGPDFIAELTYGPGAAWHRNVLAAGGCTVLSRGVEHRISSISPCDPDVGMRAFGRPIALGLRLLRRSDFCRLHGAG